MNVSVLEAISHVEGNHLVLGFDGFIFEFCLGYGSRGNVVQTVGETGFVAESGENVLGEKEVGADGQAEVKYII